MCTSSFWLCLSVLCGRNDERSFNFLKWMKFVFARWKTVFYRVALCVGVVSLALPSIHKGAALIDFFATFSRKTNTIEHNNALSFVDYFIIHLMTLEPPSPPSRPEWSARSTLIFYQQFLSFSAREARRRKLKLYFIRLTLKTCDQLIKVSGSLRQPRRAATTREKRIMKMCVSKTMTWRGKFINWSRFVCRFREIWVSWLSYACVGISAALVDKKLFIKNASNTFLRPLSPFPCLHNLPSY